MKRKYVDSLTDREIDDLNSKILTLESKNQTLQNENDRLSAIIHKDNKLMVAMLLAVRNMEYELADEPDASVRKEKLQKILAQLEESAGDRANTLNNYEFISRHLQETGCSRIDSLISYMNQRAFSEKISFQFILDNAFMKKVQKSITTEDLETLLADLLENAVIATKNQEKRNILLSLNLIDHRPVLAVYDSGVPFPEEVKAAWGIRRLTTHADANGSGIGMMSTHDLCLKCDAEFRIEDCEPGMDYTKCISVTFPNRDY